MSRNQCFSTGLLIGLAVLGCILLQTVPVRAQSNYRDTAYYGGSIVGGVFVDPDGLCAEASRKEMQEIGRTLARLLEPIPDDLNRPTPIRKISLRKLDAAIRDTIERRAEFPDSIRYLGGLTSLRYVVAVPEENDLILVGAAEGWKADPAGNIVGKTSGRPVFRLEDLLTIFRGWNANERPSVITCSIDPTPEALARIAKVNSGFGVVTRDNARAFAAAQEDAYGMNVVTVRGVPDNSRFAKILVAADYKM